MLKAESLPELEVTKASASGNKQQDFSSYSYSVHFAEVHVHSMTGMVKIKRYLACVDAGRVLNQKTGGSQVKGAVVGGIGMALQEEAVMDHRYGRFANGNFADYHVPVNADVPDIELFFTDNPDPVLNPMGAKGMGEIGLIGAAPAIANAVFHATGKRVRELPITPDKLI